MPLMMCPNDNAAMQTIDRGEVQFDMCPTCRGVWLDRGELERLLAAARDEMGAERPEARGQADQSGHGERPRHDDHLGRGGHGYGRGRKSRSIFDIFD